MLMLTVEDYAFCSQLAKRIVHHAMDREWREKCEALENRLRLASGFPRVNWMTDRERMQALLYQIHLYAKGVLEESRLDSV